MEFRQFVVRKISEESADVRTFFLSRPDGSVPAYQPGQFFLLRLPEEGGRTCQRSYSAASHPSESLLLFCIKLKGAFTHLLWKLKEGDSVEVDGPYGTFLLRADDAERVFIGGGVGISALRSMILQTLKEGKKAHLFHCAHWREGLTYYEEMKSAESFHPSFRFYPSITGEEVPGGWGGLTGRITVQMLKEKLGTLSGKAYYLCGSKEMAGTLASALIAEGVPKELVKKDEWG